MNLLPLLRRGECGIAAHEIERFGQRLQEQCRTFVETLLPFTDGQRQFLDLLLEKGVSDASLLTASPALEAKINALPGYVANARTPFPHNARRDSRMFLLTRYAYRSHDSFVDGRVDR